MFNKIHSQWTKLGVGVAKNSNQQTKFGRGPEKGGVIYLAPGALCSVNRYVHYARMQELLPELHREVGAKC